MTGYLARLGFPCVAGGPWRSGALESVAARLGATPMAVALAWLLQRSPNILLIPGTSSAAHLPLAGAALNFWLSYRLQQRTHGHPAV